MNAVQIVISIHIYVGVCVCVCVCVCVYLFRVCLCVFVNWFVYAYVSMSTPFMYLTTSRHELDATQDQFSNGVLQVYIQSFLLLDRLPYQG